MIRPHTQDYKLGMIADSLEHIRHWDVRCSDYKDIENVEATWFIDPPYSVGGQYYKFSNKSIDYPNLSEWCKERNGQVIVCENSNAEWMDFKPLAKMRGNLKNTVECMWTNYD